MGRLVLDPRKAAAAITLRHNEAEFSRHFPPPDPAWSSSHLIEAIDNAAIEPRAVHTSMLHCLLSAQRHPPGYGGVACPYYHLAQPDISDRLLRRCPPFFLQYHALAWRLLRHRQVFPLLSPSAGSADLHLGAFLATPRLVVGLMWNALPSPPPQAVLNRTPRHLLLVLNGSWNMVSEDSRRPPSSTPSGLQLRPTITSPLHSTPPHCAKLSRLPPPSGPRPHPPFPQLYSSTAKPPPSAYATVSSSYGFFVAAAQGSLALAHLPASPFLPQLPHSLQWRGSSTPSVAHHRRPSAWLPRPQKTAAW